MTPDPTTVACPYCRARAGDGCCTYRDTLATRPHKRRAALAWAVAAHADPALDEFFPKLGPCGLCGIPGLNQRHRTIDAMASRMAAGESVEDVADDYDEPAEAMEAVLRWALRWPEAQ